LPSVMSDVFIVLPFQGSVVVCVLYQIRFWLSTLQEPVGSRPSEHSTPSRWSDTIGAGDAVADVSDEASSSHCVCLVALYDPIILYLSAKVNPNLHSKSYFVKVVISR
jgi:hypothetical protein